LNNISRHGGIFIMWYHGVCGVDIKKLDIFVNLVYHREYLMGTGLVSDISKNRKNYAY